MNLFLAKSNPKETIIEHTNNLLKEYENIKRIYPKLNNLNWDILQLACIYHDLGKMNSKFQNKIIKNINIKNNNEDLKYLNDYLEEIEEIPHGYLSNAFIPVEYLKERYKEEEIRILYESIFYHHNREKLNKERKNHLKKIIENDLSKYIESFHYNKLIKGNNQLDSKFLKVIKERILIDYLNDEVNLEVAKKLIMTKGLLNKIDYAASSGVNVEIEAGDLENLTIESIKPYELNDLQNFMKKNQNDNLIIKASTGIGKTEGALVWIGNNKGFFTLPLRVSINSIYDRIITKINYGKEKTALLHSESASEYLKRDNENELDKEYLDATKQLSYPLTICTLDQLIDFIFKYEGFELKLATLSYSKIVIDEIQMYSSNLVAYLILAIKEIVNMGGKFAIVTATFPPIFENLLNYAGIKDYKKSEKPFLKKQNNKVMLRHKIKVFEKVILAEDIINGFKNQKILVIVNTVKKAQELYNELEKNEELKDKLFMFHSRYIKRDRAEKEKSIFRDGQLKNDFEGIWITTQVVEASLDIDFDLLYTELSDISGLLQRMGRTYRNRILNNDSVNINIYVGDKKNLPSGIGRNNNSIIDKDIFEYSRKIILEYDGCELNEEEKMIMVDKVYSKENLEDSKYYKDIKSTINKFNNIIPYDLKKNEERLREIYSETIIPENIYEIKKEEILNALLEIEKEGNFSKRIKLKNNIMENTLSIPSSIFENLKNNLAIKETLDLSKYEKIYVIPGIYSFEKGLEYTEQYTKNKKEFFSESQIF